MAQSPTHPRFPYIPAAVCAVCLVLTGWTWMRYSYAWDVTPCDLYLSEAYEGNFVRLHGRILLADYSHPLCLMGNVEPPDDSLFFDRSDANRGCYTVLAKLPQESVGQLMTFTGRIGTRHNMLDTISSRFTWHSITGLVVGALGVGVFAFFLVKWLNQRRSSGVEQPEAKA
jgi:hypothetical protein